jgi:excisionase family DNA binding protein
LSTTEINAKSSASLALLDTEQVAALLGLRPNTLAQWRVSGEGPMFVKIGRRVRYRASDVDAWITKRSRRSTCDAGAVAM